MSLLPLKDALAIVTENLFPVDAEMTALPAAYGRVLAEDITGPRDQPPLPLSAMDGYAVRAADVADAPAELTLIGEAPAGAQFDGTVTPGTCVRIFTGGPLPEGADTVVIQENTEREGDQVRVMKSIEPGRNVREAGIDFAKGERLLGPGARLYARQLALAAHANRAWLSVRRKPRVALLSTGDELQYPGAELAPTAVANSNNIGLAALIRSEGGVPIDLGIARDSADALRQAAEGVQGADLLVTTGGASVGDHDLVRQVLGDSGLEIYFWRVAMRPGKPTFFGRMGETPLLGFPGNPVSAMVCALLFLVPAMRRLLGTTPVSLPFSTAVTAEPIGANNEREDFMRGRVVDTAGDLPSVAPLPSQDSSLLSALAAAEVLIHRPPHAPAADAGSVVPILSLSAGLRF